MVASDRAGCGRAAAAGGVRSRLNDPPTLWPQATGNTWIFEVAVTLVFMADMVLNFNTAFLEDNYWVVSRKRIAVNYLKVGSIG